MPTQTADQLSPLPPLPNASFERLGSSLHFMIRDHTGLKAVLDLDEALWIATTAPVETIKADKTFLSFLDSDGDRRIRAEEIKDGIRFLLHHLADCSGIQEGNTTLALAAIAKGTELGKRIHASAQKVLRKLASTATSVRLEQIRKVQDDVLKGGLDQAGIVLPEAADDDKILHYIKDILRTAGGKQHPNGKDGVDSENLTSFTDQCNRYLAWQLEAGEIAGDGATRILPLGDKTAEGHALFHELEDKFTQYFLLCNIKKLNPGLLARALDVPEANIAYNLIDSNEAKSFLQTAPLSLLNSDGRLDLSEEINPYFRKKIELLNQIVIHPLLGEETTSINSESVQHLKDIFQPFVEWSARKPQVQVDILEPDKIQEYISDSTYLTSLEQLIAESFQTAFVLENLKELERLLLYQANMLSLVNSFVSFPKLYDPCQRALFEEGTLVMDGRHFTLAIQVEDREHHIETSKKSNIFVIYCELFGVDGEKKCEVAVPVTSGNRGNIHLNKWGIFNDIYGNELHARVVDIVENPISISEAMFEPFIRVSNAFFSRLEEFSSKAEERLFKKVEKSKNKKDKEESSAGFLAGIGVAVAALGSSFAFITKTLAALSVKTVLISLLAVAALLTIPAGIAAYYKLSRRDLSSILEGSGWGVNARMKLTAEQATCFTCRPELQGSPDT